MCLSPTPQASDRWVTMPSEGVATQVEKSFLIFSSLLFIVIFNNYHLWLFPCKPQKEVVSVNIFA